VPVNRPPEGPFNAGSAQGPGFAAGQNAAWPPTQYWGSQPPVGPRPTRHPAIPALSALIVLLLIVGGVLFAVGSNDSGAQGKVMDAINSAFSEKSAHVTMTETETVTGTGSVDVTGSGDIDFANDAMQLQETVEVGGHSETIQAIYLNGTIYEQVPGIDEILPGKSWISVDLSQLTKVPGSSSGLGGLGTDPVAMLHLLAQQGNTVTPSGATTVDGVPVQGYNVDLNPASITSMLQGSNLPSWLRQVVSSVTFNDASEQVYIDDSGNLRRTTNTVSAGVGSTSVTEHGDMEYSDYGETVSVTAPPADQVASFDQFLQAAGSSVGGST
jgi:hypothetical protein